MTTATTEALRQLEANDREIIPYYRLATILIVMSLLLHLAFATYFIFRTPSADTGTVYLFLIFNLAAIVVELYLIRIAFMLGSRAGQLRDLQYALRIACTDIDTARFEAACRVIMATRRNSSGLKVFDLESIARQFSSKKADRDAA